MSVAAQGNMRGMARLRTVSPSSRGWTRKGAGRGFAYYDEHGNRLGGEEVLRIKSLVIPPAWKDVWICPYPNGHIQAVGTDDAGRRQYLYHPDWRATRDQLKFDRVLEAAAALPKTRSAVHEHLGLDGMPLQRAAATAVRLLDLGCFRIGSEEYVDENGGVGLTTLEKRHVRRSGAALVFCFHGKSGVEQSIEIDDAPVIGALQTMRRRRGGDRLLAYKERSRWAPLDAATVNDYLRTTSGAELTAKDFRTWHATVLAAAALADSLEERRTKTARKKAVVRAMDEVAEYLGNTRSIAKASYVDPRVVDLYEDGVTIASAVRRTYPDPDKRPAALERAVLRLLAD
jgi:DNA topoisomerase IB